MTKRDPRFRNASRVFPRAALSALLPLAIAQIPQAHAACTPGSTSGNDTVLCTGATNTPLDAGAGDDGITNQGTVTATRSTLQSAPPALPDFSQPGTRTVSNEVTADLTAIGGGAGNDTINNTGTASSAAQATLQSISAPVSLAGGQVVKATNTVEATATGIAGNDGADAITNASGGQVQASSTARLTNVNVEHNFLDASRGNVSTAVIAGSIGIDAGAANGASVTNAGQVNAVASARSGNTNVEINLVDAAVADASLEVAARADAISAGFGAGTITNTGSLVARADARAADVSVNMSYVDATVVESKSADGGTTAEASSTGINGSESTGSLTLSNAGLIDVEATAQGNSLGISLASEGAPQGLRPLIEGILDEKGIASIGLTMRSNATGMLGGGSADTLSNTNRVQVLANSDASQQSINVGVSLIDWKIPTPGIVLGSAGTGAVASGTALDGGAGNDRITNAASVSATSVAAASATTVSANISGFTDSPLGGGSIPVLGSFGASLALADTTTKAQAAATGLRGNDGDDTIANNADLAASAESAGNAISVAATVNIKYKEGENLFGPNAVGARAITLAEATAIGIDGGLADYDRDEAEDKKTRLTTDNDVITNSGTITVHAETEVLTVAVGVTVAGSVKGGGVLVSAAATDTSSLGFALALGVDGGGGNDRVTNTGTIVAGADVDAVAASASLSVTFEKNGGVVGAALARSESTADATAMGIQGGAGDDALTNDQHIEAHANADALAVAVSIAASATANGVAISGSLADASGNAIATAVGMDGGTDNDNVRNTSTIEVSNVTANATAASVGVNVSGTNNGIAAGISIADSSANATAIATALAGGAGNDMVVNTGGITLRDIVAGADSTDVAVNVTAALNAGIAAGVAMTDSSAQSSVIATGLAGGAGDDVVVNTGTITATDGIGAHARATDVAASINVSMAGGALSAALSDSSAGAATRIAGIDGGSGNDAIDNRGAITLLGTSDVDALSIDIAISAALGVGGSAALANADATAATTVTGIDGGTGRNDIANRANLDVTSRSSAESFALGVSGTLAFGADATLVDARGYSTATAVGIGEAGSPTVAGEHGNILNTGSLGITTDATVKGTALSLALRGYGLGETSVTATADGYGIQSGAAASIIDNQGVIDVTSHAMASGLALSALLAGKGIGNSDTTADARASGIVAGAGDDVVRNGARIDLDASSESLARSVSVLLAGSASTDAKAQAFTTATALDGGDGNDQLLNEANLAVTATSTTIAEGIRVQLAGASSGDVSNTPVSLATAMSGGAGDDTALLGGANVSVIAKSVGVATDAAWGIGGATGSRAGVDATATAVGMDGGSGADTLVQRAGALDVQATSLVGVADVAWEFAGTSNAASALSAHTGAVGLDGGAGADLLRNETAFTATTYSRLVTTGSSKAIFGNASSSTEVGADSTTVGLSGGSGDDRIENVAAMTLQAESLVSSTRVAFTFAGSANIDELLRSRSTVTGIDGGSGDDIILNTADINGTALAAAATIGKAGATLGGGSTASGKAIAEALATGIDGGEGADTIDNRGALHISASIDPRTDNNASAGTFFGDGRVEGQSRGLLVASGIDAGNGNNAIANRADIIVTVATDEAAQAATAANGSGFSFGADGDAIGHSQADVEARAIGIGAGDGDSQVLNAGAIAVHMEGALASAYTNPNGGDTSGDGEGNIDATSKALGRGIQLGNGNGMVVNDGTIDLWVNPVARGESDADGTASDNANSTINTLATADARGIVTGNGNQQITSNGAIHVTAAPMVEGRADVDGGHTLGGASGSANGRAEASARGIEAGDGNTVIQNNALLLVVAASNARAFQKDGSVSVNVNANGHGEGDANAYVTSRSLSEAYGIKVGNGEYSILNTDTIEVSANAVVSAGYNVSPGNLNTGHAYSATRLLAEGRAVGIWIEGGTAEIINRGTINVTATPTLSIAHEGGDGGPYRLTETLGTAVGMSGGSAGGARTITNDGTINVRANGSAYGVDDGDAFIPNNDPDNQLLGRTPAALGIDFRGAGFKSLVNNGTIDVSARMSTFFPGDPVVSSIAVHLQGDGVRVVNNGTITARGFHQFLFTDIAQPATAVYMRSLGNQAVTLSLGRSSVTNGDVALYGGRAVLELDGSPVLNGNFRSDASRDFDLVLHNDGQFGHALPEIAHVTKDGAGAYQLPTLNTVRGMTLNDGLLDLGGGYSFAPTGQLQAGIRGDGGNGGLRALGTVNLDGTLQVIGDAGLYTDGTRYRIVAATSIAAASAFDSIDLPQATALVAFTAERSAGAFDVVAHVESFESIASTAGRRSVARALDAVAQAPSADMRGQLAAIQHLSGLQLQQTYDSLNPVVYDFGTTAALGNLGQFDGALWQRLVDPALNAGGASAMASGDGALSASRGLHGDIQPEFGMWMRSFHRDGEQDASDAFAGHEYRQAGFALGYDHIFGDYAVGLSIGSVGNQLAADGGAGLGRVDSNLYSVYGGYSSKGRYIDGVVSYADNDYDMARQILVGGSTTAASSHEGHAISAGANGGVIYEGMGWTYGPFASLQYTRLREQAFAETGGPLALNVESRNADSLVSRLGMRIGHRITQARGEWLPELDLAWGHDFGLGDRSVRAAYAGAPDTVFAVDGLPIQRDGAVAGAGLSYRSGGFAARLSYHREFGGSSSASAWFAGLQLVL